MTDKSLLLLQGFDILQNRSKENCLNESELEIQVLEKNEGSSEVKVFESLTELANELKLGLGVSGGGGWAFVNGAVGFDVEKNLENDKRKEKNVCPSKV